MPTFPAAQVISNPISFHSVQTSPGGLLYNNTRAGSTFVVTFLNLINTSSSGGQSILIQETVSGHAVHSGNVGAGSFDRFPLTCEIALQTGHGLEANAVTGNWDVVVTGHYVPTVVGN